jgi:hypothetical protein
MPQRRDCLAARHSFVSGFFCPVKAGQPAIRVEG